MSWQKHWRDDKFVKKSKLEGKICRSYYKLLEINERFHLIGKKSINILELGGSPGGWSQSIKEVKTYLFCKTRACIVKGAQWFYANGLLIRLQT